MMAKIDVNGPDAIPLFQWLRADSSLEGAAIPWNFAKFLLNYKGEIVKYFIPTVNPNLIVPDIVELLEAPMDEDWLLEQPEEVVQQLLGL